MELLLGCGSARDKRLWVDGKEEWSKLVTLDYNLDHSPDVIWDLRKLPWPFEDDTFDEVHAYEVLEHLGQQGDYKAFFAQFSEIWRITKAGGMLFATVPWWQDEWAWGDPSHTRVITPATLTFLSQIEYEKQVGKTAMSDFRNIYTADFERAYVEQRDPNLYFALSVVKPSRHRQALPL